VSTTEYYCLVCCCAPFGAPLNNHRGSAAHMFHWECSRPAAPSPGPFGNPPTSSLPVASRCADSSGRHPAGIRALAVKPPATTGARSPPPWASEALAEVQGAFADMGLQTPRSLASAISIMRMMLQGHREAIAAAATNTAAAAAAARGAVGQQNTTRGLVTVSSRALPVLFPAGPVMCLELVNSPLPMACLGLPSDVIRKLVHTHGPTVGHLAVVNGGASFNDADVRAALLRLCQPAQPAAPSAHASPVTRAIITALSTSSLPRQAEVFSAIALAVPAASHHHLAGMLAPPGDASISAQVLYHAGENLVNFMASRRANLQPTPQVPTSGVSLHPDDPDDTDDTDDALLLCFSTNVECAPLWQFCREMVLSHWKAQHAGSRSAVDRAKDDMRAAQLMKLIAVYRGGNKTKHLLNPKP